MATAYTNLGGNGNRQSTIGYSTNTSVNNYIIGGAYGNSTFFTTVAAVAGLFIRFQFNITQNGSQSVVIDEAKWYQSSAQSQGVWQWQGSNDGVSWTNIGSNFTLGGATTNVITALNGNVTGWSWYQMLGISGTTNTTPWTQGIDFQISGFAFTPQFPVLMNNTLFFSQTPTFPPLMQRPYFTVVEDTINKPSVEQATFFYGWNNQISFSGNPVPVAQVLKGATINVTYSETISAQAGTPPYTFSVSAGSLPTGLSLNSSTGVISGTPTALGTYSFTIQATDNLLATGTQPFSITVAAPAASNYGYFN